MILFKLIIGKSSVRSILAITERLPLTCAPLALDTPCLNFPSPLISRTTPLHPHFPLSSSGLAQSISDGTILGWRFRRFFHLYTPFLGWKATSPA